MVIRENVEHMSSIHETREHPQHETRAIKFAYENVTSPQKYELLTLHFHDFFLLLVPRGKLTQFY